MHPYAVEAGMPRPYNCSPSDAGIAQLVERNLAKVEVASSRLVSRSIFLAPVGGPGRLPYNPPLFGGMAEWSCSGLRIGGLAARWQSGHAADCKSVYVGSIPARAS